MTYAVFVQYGRCIIDHEYKGVVGRKVKGRFRTREQASDWFAIKVRISADNEPVFPGDWAYYSARIPKWIDEEEIYAELGRD